MSNPMYEAQLNKHEDQLRDIEGRLHSYDLGLRWCEEQIKKIAGDDYSPCVVIDNPIEKEYDKLKGDHNLLKEAYKTLDDRYEREKVNWMDTVVKKNEKITDLECSVKTKSEAVDHLRSELEKWKEAYLRSQVDVDQFQRAYTEAKKANDYLKERLVKYSWKRVDISKPLPFKDHELYLFAIDGYSTPVKGKYHYDDPSYISIIVDDGDGKGPHYKVFFFMDGVIRYWMPLPEMPETDIK